MGHWELGCDVSAFRRLKSEENSAEVVLSCKGEGLTWRTKQIWSLPRHGVLRGACHRAAVRAGPLARNDDVEAMAATKQPAGQIGKKLSSPWLKNIPLNPSGKSALPLRASHPTRGALRTSRTRGGMRWTG